MRKDRIIRLRCTEEEAARWQESAGKGNLLLSEWVRNRLNEAAAGEVIRVDSAQRVNSLIGRTFYPVEPKPVATKKPVATPSRLESYLEEKAREVTEGLRQSREDEVRQILDAPPADAPIAGLKFVVTAEEKSELRKVPKFPEGHSMKCVCVKCQKARGWRG